MTTLHSLEAISAFFQQSRRPVAYINTTTFNLLGAESWIGGLEFVSSVDGFGGRHPRVFTPGDAGAQPLGGIESANRYLLSHPEAQAHLAGRGPGLALFLMFDEVAEAAVAGLGWQVAFPSARIRRHLDSKVTTTELGNRAGVPSVPNVLAPVASYTELRRVARYLGPDLVVQLPYGDSGATTFFISSAADFAPHAEVIAAQPAVKVMRRIRCRPTTIEGCVTRHGTLAGPLLTELVGLPELTPLRGGWCGNEYAAAQAGPFSDEVRRQALAIVKAIGAELRRSGYWGVFGLDLLLDSDSGALYLGELNPRITGATPMTSQAARDQGLPPLLAFHLLEALGVDYALDVAAYNRRWLEAAGTGGWSQLIVEHLGPGPAAITAAPAAGAWRLRPDGGASYLRPAFAPEALVGDDEALVLPTALPGKTAPSGYSLCRLVLRGRVMGHSWQLNSRARAWIQALRGELGLEAPAMCEAQPAGMLV